MSEKKFAALEGQKNELWAVFKVPAFIDIKKEKLYIIDEKWNNEYVF